MRRREVLRAAGALVGAAGLAGATGASQADAEPYAPLGRVAVEGSAEAVVGDDGTTAYLAASDGFATVDVSDPADPTVLAERRELLADREDGPMAEVFDVAVDGDRLLVAGPANPGVESPSGVLLYDVADPAAPRQLAFHPSEFHVHNCFLDGDVAYLTSGSSGQRLELADVADDDPTTLSTWGPVDHEPALADLPGASLTVHDVYVADGRAYLPCWDAGTYVLDVSDPAEPAVVATVSDYTLAELEELGRADGFIPPGNHHYARATDDGSLLAVGRESWDFDGADGGPGGITLYDLAADGGPAELATVEPERARDETFESGVWTTSHNFDLVGDRLYSSWYQAGVKLHDVSDPADPELLAWWRDPDDAAFWTAQRAAGDAVVASTHAVPPQTAPFEGLYTFPDRAGEQADPPTIPSPTPTPTPSPSPTTSHTPTRTPTSSPTPTATPPPTATPTDAGTENRATGDGFGLLAGLAALGGAAWWRRRRD